MAGAYPTYICEIAFSGGTATSWRIDISTFGSSDGLTDALPGYDSYTGTYDDVSADVKSIEIRRGREDTLQDYQAGQAIVVLDDTAGNQSGTAGLYNPENAGGGLGGSIVPMMPLRIAAVYSGSTVELYRGLVTSWDASPVDGNAYYEATVVADDVYNWLSAARPTIATTPSTTGEAIGQILDAVEFSDADFRSLDEGDTLPAGSFSLAGSISALEAVAGLLDTERGAFFVDKGGTVVYRDRHTQSSQATAGTITASIAFGASSLDVNRIRNAAIVTPTGGTAEEYVDGNSASNYGRRYAENITSPYITATQAQSLAEYLATTRSSATVDTRRITLRNTTDQIDELLAVDVAARWEIVSAFGGGTVDTYIEAVNHRIAERFHECDIVVAKRPTGSPFIFDSSTFDGTDTFSY